MFIKKVKSECILMNQFLAGRIYVMCYLCARNDQKSTFLCLIENKASADIVNRMVKHLALPLNGIRNIQSRKY